MAAATRVGKVHLPWITMRHTRAHARVCMPTAARASRQARVCILAPGPRPPRAGHRCCPPLNTRTSQRDFTSSTRSRQGRTVLWVLTRVGQVLPRSRVGDVRVPGFARFGCPGTSEHRTIATTTRWLLDRFSKILLQVDPIARTYPYPNFSLDGGAHATKPRGFAQSQPPAASACSRSLLRVSRASFRARRAT